MKATGAQGSIWGTAAEQQKGVRLFRLDRRAPYLQERDHVRGRLLAADWLRHARGDCAQFADVLLSHDSHP